MIISVLTISNLAHPRFKRMMKAVDGMNGAIQENLIGIRIVKAYVRGDFEEKKFRKAADEVRRAQVHAEKLIIFMMPIMQLVMYVSMIAVMWFGGRLVVGGHMLSGELISFFTYVTQVLSSIMFLGMVFVSLVMVQASNQRIVEVLDEVPDIENPANPVTEVKDGSITFENVNFSYNKKEDNCILRNVNLNIKSGSVVGIIDIPDVQVATQKLYRGDVILMASDGVSEVMDDSGTELGDTELYKNTLCSSAKKHPKEFVDDIVDLDPDVRIHTAKYADLLCILLSGDNLPIPETAADAALNFRIDGVNRETAGCQIRCDLTVHI